MDTNQAAPRSRAARGALPAASGAPHGVCAAAPPARPSSPSSPGQPAGGLREGKGFVQGHPANEQPAGHTQAWATARGPAGAPGLGVLDTLLWCWGQGEPRGEPGTPWGGQERPRDRAPVPGSGGEDEVGTVSQAKGTCVGASREWGACAGTTVTRSAGVWSFRGDEMGRQAGGRELAMGGEEVGFLLRAGGRAQGGGERGG